MSEPMDVDAFLQGLPTGIDKSGVEGAFTEQPTVNAGVPPDEADIVGGFGGAIGGGLGMVAGGATAGFPGAAWGATKGALTGFTLAREGYRALQGDPNASRNLVVGVGSGLLAGGLLSKTAGLASQIAVNAGLMPAVGAAYDAAVQGKAPSVETAVGDAAAGAAGAALGYGIGKVDAKVRMGKFRRYGTRPLEEQQQITDFATQEGIQLPVQGVTNSSVAAAVEKSGARSLLGGSRGVGFHLEGVRQAEDAVVRTLDKIDALDANRSPTKIGQQVKRLILGDPARYLADPNYEPGIRRHMSNAFQHVAKLEEAHIQEPVVTRNLMTAAEDILGEMQKGLEKPAPEVTAVLERLANRTPATPSQVAGPIGMKEMVPGTPAVTEPMSLSWSEARRALSDLGKKTFGSNPILAKLGAGLDTVQRKRLGDALKQDMADTMKQVGARAVPIAPDQAWKPGAEHTAPLAEMSAWNDEAYGMASDAVKNRLMRLAKMRNAEQVLPAMLQPDNLEEMAALKNMLPTDVWEQAATGKLAQWYQKAGGASQPGAILSTQGRQVTFQPGKFWRQVEPYVKSGAAELMFPPQIVPIDPVNPTGPWTTMEHPTLTWLKSFGTMTRAIQQGEKLAANASGTAQAEIRQNEIKEIAKHVTLPLTMAAVGAQYGAGAGAMAGLAGAGALAYEVATPAVANWLSYSKPGQALMTRAINGKDPTALSAILFRNSIANTAAQSAKERFQ